MQIETSPSNGVIWDELSEQHQHQIIKKVQNFVLNLHLFGANKVQI